MSRGSNQASEQRQILRVLFQIRPLGRFEAHRDAPEALVVHQQTKGLDADEALDDMFMAVDAGVNAAK